MQELRPGFGPRPDEKIDHRGAIPAAVIGIAVVADRAQIGGIIVAHDAVIGFCPIGIDHADRNRQRVRLHQIIRILEGERMTLIEKLRRERRDHSDR